MQQNTDALLYSGSMRIQVLLTYYLNYPTSILQKFFEIVVWLWNKLMDRKNK